MLQHPTCVLYFLSVAIIYAAPRMDESLQVQEEEEKLMKSTPTDIVRRR
jgi:hypothetical protein